jgi:ubiquinone biosynthesis protein UbiJ
MIVTAGLAVSAFLFWVWRLLSAFNAKLAERDTAAQLEKERAKIAEETLRRELNEYKVHAAEKYATKDGMTQAIGRMESAVERLTTQVHDAVERLTDRLDRMLERDGGAKK